MKNGFVAVAILVLALFAGAAVTIEQLTLFPDSAVTDRCAGTNCN
jgi:hypothetical protein